MVLTKNEYKAAQQLARDLIELKQRKQKEKERINQAIKTVAGIAESVVKRGVEIFDTIKTAIMKISESLEDIEKTKELRESWHVPINFKMPKAPFVENYNLQYARNNL